MNITSKINPISKMRRLSDVVLTQADQFLMYYVYLIKSVSHPNEIYIGYTKNLNGRLAQHNNGNSFHTSKYAPWELMVYLCFNDEHTAVKFEKYLKSCSGRAFIHKRLQTLN